MPPRRNRNPYRRRISREVEFATEQVVITWGSAFKIAVAIGIVAMVAGACYGIFLYAK